MITTCTECQARYQLDDEKIPRRKIRVRCPACSGVFPLDGTRAGATVDKAVPEPLVSAPYESPAPAADDIQISNDFNDSFAPPPAAPVAAQAGPAAPATRPEPAHSSVAVLDQSAPEATPRRRRSKEEMLARALVSDILVYNRDLRDKALASGNLLEALGGEIKKSWELYKEKVTPEVANSTNHFRDALNEILAEGKKVF